MISLIHRRPTIREDWPLTNRFFVTAFSCGHSGWRTPQLYFRRLNAASRDLNSALETNSTESGKMSK